MPTNSRRATYCNFIFSKKWAEKGHDIAYQQKLKSTAFNLSNYLKIRIF